jgi:hypothetical protein
VTSFATGGGTNSGPTGQLCGNASAASLAQAPVASQLLSGPDKCNEGYSSSNSMIDVFISGCTVSIFNIPIINPTQPDTSDPDQTAGAGPPYTLSASNTTTHVVDTCKDKANNSVALATCLKAAAYSSSFKFAVDRVIFK